MLYGVTGLVISELSLFTHIRVTIRKLVSDRYNASACSSGV